MQGIKPRSLNNSELIRFSAEHLDRGALPNDYAIELLRRLNYYTQNKERENATEHDPRQQTLPL
jgi:hypothetical protein